MMLSYHIFHIRRTLTALCSSIYIQGLETSLSKTDGLREQQQHGGLV